MQKKFVATAFLVMLSSSMVLAADKGKKVTFDEHVLPLLREKCASCHDSDKMRGGLNITTYTALMEGGGSGAVVKPGDSEGSRLFATIAHKVQPFMPPKAPQLPKESLEVVRAWIDGGALENAGSKPKGVRPTMDIGLSSVAKGKPEGPPPMPVAGKVSIDPVVTTARPNVVTAMASSPWAPLVAVGGQKQVLLYNSDNFDLMAVLPFPYGMPTVVKFSRNGSLVLAGGGRGGQSGKVVVWSVTTGEKIIEVGTESDSVLAADISADQTQIALGGPGKTIRIYSTKTGELLREIRKHTDWLYSMEYSPDGVLLATADRNGGLFVWEAYTGREYFNLRGHTAAITDVSWRADSNVLASCSEDSTVRLWEMENGGQIRSWGAHGGGTLAVRYSRDGRLATVGRDRTPKVWDQNGAQQKAFEALPDVATRTTFTHDAARLVAADWTGLIKVWNVADGKMVGQLSANPLPPAAQFDAAMKDLAAKQVAYEQARAAADAAQAGANQANANLAAAQKAAADAVAAMKAAENNLNTAKAQHAAVTANMGVAQAKVTAKEFAAKAMVEVTAKVKDAADKAKGDAALVAEFQKFQGLVTQAIGELDAAKNALAGANNAVQAALQKMNAAQAAMAPAAAAVAPANKLVEARAAEAKAAGDRLNAARTAGDQAMAAVLAATKVAVEKYKHVAPK